MTAPVQEPLLSRREAFSCSVRDGGKILGRLLELSTLSLAPIMYELQERERKSPGVIAAQTPGTSATREVAPLDVVSKNFHHLPGNVKLHSLGVLHPTGGDDVDVSPARPYIRGADVVLLESEQVLNAPSQTLLWRGCFADLRREALTANKEVYDIDVKSTATNHVYECETARASLVGAVGLAATSFDKIRNQAITLRRFLRVLGWSAAAVSIASPQWLVHPAADLSFAQDGRTVLMLRNVLDIAKQNAGKIITVIAGNEHAKGFEFYLRHPLLFDLKFALYKDTYLKAISGPPERVFSVGTIQG